jgi:hypothetical protein
MNTTTNEPVIIGLCPRGTVVHITDDRTELNGHTVVVTGDNGPTGGIAGGGVVTCMSATSAASHRISRYTRVTVLDQS